MRTIIVGSLGLNAVLLTALAYVSVRGPAPSQQEGAPPTPVEASRRPSGTRNSTVVTVDTAAPFHWSEIESTDFKQYMANLRAMGCPEETIRDLIIAEVNKMFSPRFLALAAETGKFEYWNRRAKGKETLLAQLRALRDERRALLRELIGIDDDPYAKWANIDLEQLRAEGKYTFLSAEKQTLVRAIM